MAIAEKGVLRPIPLHGAYTDFVLRNSLDLLRREPFTCCAGGKFIVYPDTIHRTEFERNSGDLSTGNLTDFSTRTTWTADKRFRDTATSATIYHRPWQTDRKDSKNPEFQNVPRDKATYLEFCMSSMKASGSLICSTQCNWQQVVSPCCSDLSEDGFKQPSADESGPCLWRPFGNVKEKTRFDLGSGELIQRDKILCTPSDHSAMLDYLSGTNGTYDFLQKKVKRIKCPFCQVACLNNGQMMGHLRVHTGEKPYQCDHLSCGKRFARNEELTRHKRIHSGERPHECETCHKRFGRKDHLTKHRKTHQKASERRIYVCQVPECEHRYTRSDALTRHQWTVHNIRWKPTTHTIRKSINKSVLSLKHLSDSK